MQTKSWVYVNSVVRALEPKLIAEERLIRLMDAKDVESALRILSESGFGEGGVGSYEGLISAEDAHLAAFIRENAPARLADILLVKREFHNAKVLIKAKYLRKTDVAGLVYEGTNLPPEMLQERLENDDYAFLPDRLRTALEACDGCMAGERDPMRADVILDRACYAELFSLLARYDNPVLTDYYRAEVDFINLGTVARCRRLQLDAEFFGSQFIEGGLLDFAHMTGFLDLASDGFLEALRFTPYRELAEGLGSSLTEGPVAFERAYSDALLQRLLPKKDELFTDMPFICYVFRKWNELINVRLIMVAKASGASMEEVKKRLRLVG